MLGVWKAVVVRSELPVHWMGEEGTQRPAFRRPQGGIVSIRGGAVGCDGLHWRG